MPDTQSLLMFKTIFISIFLEAVPFLFLGVLVSSFMQLFISEEMIRRFIPRNPVLGVMFGCTLGVLFPLCECGIIPIIRRLISKGMPMYIGIVFILAGPIVNPIVYLSTRTAFRNWPELVYSRMGLAVLVSASIGIILYRFVRMNPLKHSSTTFYEGNGDAAGGQRHRSANRLISMFEHAGSEFFDMGKYFIAASLVTSFIQTYVPRDNLMEIGQGEVVSHLFMMGFAYILSICSTSDAFVAASFASTFSAGSILSFMVFGPMLDFKSTMMLLSVFKAKFVLILMLLITLLTFVGSYIIGQVYL